MKAHLISHSHPIKLRSASPDAALVVDLCTIMTAVCTRCNQTRGLERNHFAILGMSDEW